MNTYISHIFLFGKSEEVRTVKLERGLNLITGDSKTGKSALIEIVDYCLFSKRSTIPKGKIDNFSELYSIVLKLNGISVVIARSKLNPAKAYINIETNDEFLSDFKKNYFNHLQSKPFKDAQFELEKHLGLSVSDTRTSEDDDKRNAGKTTLRSLVSLLFQHQNLVANKHSVFYRFDDYHKRKKTIDDYPMALGWASSEYFLNLRELEDIQASIRTHEKLVSKTNLSEIEISNHLNSLIASYYQLIGLEFNYNLPFPGLVQLSKNLPELENFSYANSDLGTAIFEKKEEQASLEDQLRKTLAMLKSVESNEVLSGDYAKELKFLDKISAVELTSDKAVCPVCNKENDDIKFRIQGVTNAREDLIQELEKIGSYKEDNSGLIESLRKERNSIKRKISRIASQISLFEEQDQSLKAKKSLRDQAFQMKGMTQANIETLLSINKQATPQADIEESKKRAEHLKNELKKFDLKGKAKQAEGFLSEKMTSICNQLDFEEELKPGTLKFELDTFDLHYLYKNKEKIHLSEMGSGANWLACHLSLFLSLLHLNCIEEHSSIPAILFFDQPSQVYFPSKYGDSDGEGNLDENIIQVKNIFNVIIDTLDQIELDSGFLPQVIIMEHADEPEFDKYVRARWKTNGDKLI